MSGVETAVYIVIPPASASHGTIAITSLPVPDIAEMHGTKLPDALLKACPLSKGGSDAVTDGYNGIGGGCAAGCDQVRYIMFI
jgi:hypothetical protein